jgi:hypothetical protein
VMAGSQAGEQEASGGIGACLVAVDLEGHVFEGPSPARWLIRSVIPIGSIPRAMSHAIADAI